MSDFHLIHELIYNWKLFAAVVPAIYFVYLLGQAIYYGFFHPLSAFPGPKLAGATILPFSWHKFRGTQHTWLKELHERYGPVVRWQPDHVSFINGAAWKDIFGHKSRGRGDMPKDPLLTAEFLGGKDSILFMGDSDHSRTRRLLSHALSDRALREQQDLISSYVKTFVKRLKEAAAHPETEKVDMFRWFSFTTFDIVGDLSFGEPLGMLTSGKWAPWIQAMSKTIPISTNLSILKRISPILGLAIKYLAPASLQAPIRQHIKYSIQQVDKRMARETDRPDFWKYILRNQGKEGESLSLAETHAMGMTLMIAGSETTATTLSGLIYLLSKYPDKYDRLASEIRDTFSSTEELNMDNLARLPYLNACLEEGLRVYPPVVLGQQRVVPAGGRMVADRFVPENTIVMITHWAAYHNEMNFHRANEFLPERWLAKNQTSGEFANDQRDAFNPFSFGPRNCIGKNLAYHEMRLILAHVLMTIDFKLGKESEDWMPKQKVYGLAVKPPLMVHLTPREAPVKA